MNSEIVVIKEPGQLARLCNPNDDNDDTTLNLATPIGTPEVAKTPNYHVPTFRRRGLWLCEPENANATPEIATAVTGGAVSGVAFVFSGGRKRKCNDGRPESENFLLG